MRTLKAHFSEKTHVLWDWNGTLLDDVDLCVEVIGGMLQRQSLGALDREAYLRVFRFPIREYYKDLGFSVETAAFAQLSREFIAHYNARVKDCGLHDGARDLLDELRAEGLSLNVLSAAHEGDLKDQLAHHGILDRFDHVYGLGDHHATSKVERGHQLIAKLGVEPERVIMVGDTDHDHEVATALGIDSLLVENGHQHGDRLRAVHHRVVAR